MGGDCLNFGCVPSKALIAAAKAAQAQRDGARLRHRAGRAQGRFRRDHGSRARVIAAIAPNNSVERFEKLGVRVLNEQARFIGRDRAAGRTASASAPRRIVLATGSRPTAPPIPGLAEAALPHQRNGVRQSHAARAI